MNESIIERLKSLAKKKTCLDGFDPMTDGAPSYHCGNSDDTYQMGCDDGQAELARSILSELGISYE